MPDYLSSSVDGTMTSTTIKVPIAQTASNFCWEMEQITINYSVATDNPLITILKNGFPYAPTAITVPGPNGRSATFAGLPYLYIKAKDKVEIYVTAGSIGAVVTVFGQYREFLETDPQMYGR